MKGHHDVNSECTAINPTCEQQMQNRQSSNNTDSRSPATRNSIEYFINPQSQGKSRKVSFMCWIRLQNNLNLGTSLKYNDSVIDGHDIREERENNQNWNFLTSENRNGFRPWISTKLLLLLTVSRLNKDLGLSTPVFNGFFRGWENREPVGKSENRWENQRTGGKIREP